LVSERPVSRPRAQVRAWQRIRQVDQHTLVVYWFGGSPRDGGSPLDHIATEWLPRSLVLTLWVIEDGRLSGGYFAALVRLDRVLAAHTVVDAA
jgi:hypothetical protein